MNIILCGLPTSGKTTTGKIIAKILHRQHVDTDDLIVQNYGNPSVTTCRQIYLCEGEDFFRRFENKQILALKQHKNCIISIGGGSLSYFDNDKILKSIGCLVYLKTRFPTLWKRICQRGVLSWLDPAHPQKDFYQLMKKRQSKLDEVADIIIDTANLTPHGVAKQILITSKIGYGK